MKRTEKTDKILVKYKQYLKLEKSLSDNTVDAYLTDLDKLLAYLTLENINILDVRLENLEDFSAGLHDIGIHPRSQARILKTQKAKKINKKRHPADRLTESTGYPLFHITPLFYDHHSIPNPSWQSSGTSDITKTFFNIIQILFNKLNLWINRLLSSLFALIKYNLILLKQVAALSIDRHDQRTKLLNLIAP